MHVTLNKLHNYEQKKIKRRKIESVKIHPIEVTLLFTTA